MRTAIFIRSYAKDAPWLEYALWSIQRFAKGFAYVVVTVPQYDRDIFLPIVGRWSARLHAAFESPNKGMLHGEMRLCHADELCADADFILFMDSDCIFVEPACPSDYFVGGKPVLVCERYDKLFASPDPGAQAAARQWRPAVQQALGFAPTHETMRRHPAVFHNGLFAPFRAAVAQQTGKPFDEYVLSCRNEYPQTFAEFDSLGAFAMAACPDLYFIADVDKVDATVLSDSGAPVLAPKMRQFWSHGGIAPEIREELERVLA